MVWSSCTHLKLTLCCPSVRFPPHYNYTFVCMDVLLGGAEHTPSMGWSQTGRVHAYTDPSTALQGC